MVIFRRREGDGGCFEVSWMMNHKIEHKESVTETVVHHFRINNAFEFRLSKQTCISLIKCLMYVRAVHSLATQAPYTL